MPIVVELVHHQCSKAKNGSEVQKGHSEITKATPNQEPSPAHAKMPMASQQLERHPAKKSSKQPTPQVQVYSSKQVQAEVQVHNAGSSKMSSASQPKSEARPPHKPKYVIQIIHHNHGGHQQGGHQQGGHPQGHEGQRGRHQAHDPHAPNHGHKPQGSVYLEKNKAKYSEQEKMRESKSSEGLKPKKAKRGEANRPKKKAQDNKPVSSKHMRSQEQLGKERDSRRQPLSPRPPRPSENVYAASPQTALSDRLPKPASPREIQLNSRYLPNTSLKRLFNKEIFENYGRANVSDNADGFLYRNYMKSHNINPHSGSNLPDYQETYLHALLHASPEKLVGLSTAQIRKYVLNDEVVSPRQHLYREAQITEREKTDLALVLEDNYIIKKRLGKDRDAEEKAPRESLSLQSSRQRIVQAKASPVERRRPTEENTRESPVRNSQRHVPKSPRPQSNLHGSNQPRQPQSRPAKASRTKELRSADQGFRQEKPSAPQDKESHSLGQSAKRKLAKEQIESASNPGSNQNSNPMVSAQRPYWRPEELQPKFPGQRNQPTNEIGHHENAEADCKREHEEKLDVKARSGDEKAKQVESEELIRYERRDDPRKSAVAVEFEEDSSGHERLSEQMQHIVDKYTQGSERLLADQQRSHEEGEDYLEREVGGYPGEGEGYPGEGEGYPGEGEGYPGEEEGQPDEERGSQREEEDIDEVDLSGGKQW